jgi:beta-lactamase regulating signal transducer with metallopeptidase domain
VATDNGQSLLGEGTVMMNVMIAYVNSTADRWAAWIVAASLDAGLLLALIGLVWCAIRGRVAPQVGYCLFLLVPLKLLVPVIVTVPAAMARWTPSALLSSSLKGAHIPELFERSPPLERPIATVETDPSARPGPRFETLSQSQAVEAASDPLTIPNEPPSRRQPVPTASSLARSASEAPRLSLPAIVMIVWLVGVTLLLGRLVGSQLRFRARLEQVAPVDESRLSVDMLELYRCAGVPHTTRTVEHDSLTAPAVWGIIRPTLILPRGIACSLTGQQLRWVLFHELAHVRRRDLIVVTLQRIAAILHFFNPVIWIANRIIDQLREYACDDLAISLSHASAIESGEAFVRILQRADRRRHSVEGALGVFGLDSRASCFLRVRRLLDTPRPIRTAPGAWSLWGLVLLAVLSLPHLRAASDATLANPQNPANDSANPVNPKAAADPAPAKDSQEFELLVVGPGGKPIPEAVVELRTNPGLTDEQIRHGKLVKRGSYGAFVATDSLGRLTVKHPSAPTYFEVFIRIPGFGPYWAGWSSESHAQPIPSRFTAELEAGWSVAGIIVDSAGKPIEGVTVGPGIEFKKRPGDHRQMRGGEQRKTDAAGKWHFDSVPVSMSEVFVEINHPRFKPVRRALTRSEFGIERGREPIARIALDRGLTVTGKVTDESGKPIVGALIRTKFLNDIREAHTGADGVYTLAGCEPRSARIVVSAKGRATDMKELNIESEMQPVDFRMMPGGTVRIRALDEKGNPVPGARIFFQQWRGRFAYFEFNHISQFADKNGVWVWNEAPLDEFKADICPPDGMSLSEQPLIARPQEYVFRLPGPLVVSGKVIDAVTRKPIKEFRVVPGVRSSETHMNWVPSETFSVSDGQYRIRETHGYFAHLVRIEADGYQAAVSRDIKSNEGIVSIDFELKKGMNIVAKVVTPRNLPAVGARVALGVAGSQINIHNGDFDDGSTYCTRQTADGTGGFHFPPQDKDFQLIITHPSGYAHIKSSPEWDTARIIHLEPWARVEGTFLVGQNLAANVPVVLNVAGRDSYGNDVPSIFTQHYVTTGPGGRFVFERVIPGSGWIGRRLILTVDDGAADVTSSSMIPASFPAGKTVHIELGGTGRPVVGKLQPPAGSSGKVRWNFALVEVQPGEQEDRATRPGFTATVDRDGSFRIDDVPAGNYSLSVQFQRDDAGRLSNHRFSVPAQQGDLAAQPVDLGTLRLEKR